jgi:hypothetical protein
MKEWKECKGCLSLIKMDETLICNAGMSEGISTTNNNCPCNKCLDKRCEGCWNISSGCLVKYHPPIIDTCPCVICLVKVMCSRMCDARRNIYLILTSEVKRKVVR